MQRAAWEKLDGFDEAVIANEDANLSLRARQHGGGVEECSLRAMA